MKTSLLKLVLAAIVLSAASGPAAADAFSWVPWSSKNKPGQSASAAKKSKSGKKPGMLSKMGNGTKSFFGKTKSMLTPGKAKPKQHKFSDDQPVLRSKNKEEKPGIIKSLFAQEEPPPPKSVGEWMKLKQIKP